MDAPVRIAVDIQSRPLRVVPKAIADRCGITDPMLYEMHILCEDDTLLEGVGTMKVVCDDECLGVRFFAVVDGDAHVFFMRDCYMSDDERRLLRELQADPFTPLSDSTCERLGISSKRALSWVRKWRKRGWWDRNSKQLSEIGMRVPA